MNRGILNKFLKDQAITILVYLLNSAFIIHFFNLIHPEKTEILYPILIAVFMLLILLTIELIKYYKFNNCLNRGLKEDLIYKLKPLTCQQWAVTKVLSTMRKEHIWEVNNIKSLYDDKIHFMSQWMHNLKTPISVIELIIQKYNNHNPIPQEALKKIRLENNSLNSSVEQVLNIIRLESFEKDYEVTSIELISSLKKVINERKNQFVYNGVFPVIIQDHDNCHVLSDNKWNEVLLDQIISNAIKYSRQSEDTKKIYFSITKDEKHTHLSIRDEGIGIPPYDIKRVFEAFFTGENGRKFRNSTGIGLYICKIVAEKLGHSIEIKSEVSEGTEVIIRYLTDC